MLLLMLLVLTSLACWAIYHFCSDFNISSFFLVGVMLSTACLFIYLIIIPVNRASVRSYYYGYLEIQESIKNMEQAKGTEKTAIYLKVIEMNNTIQKNKYYAESDWISIMYDPIIFQMKPIRVGNEK